jgi:hypothetical protein
MLGMNGTTELDISKLRLRRYFIQWDRDNNDWRIRDRREFQWPTVFRHESEDVCKKMLKILNEG